MPSIHHLTFNLLQVNTYIASCGSEGCIIVDPGAYGPEEQAAFKEFISTHGLRPEAILLTHGHMDHIFGVKDAQDTYGIPVYMSPDEKGTLEYSAEMTVKLGLTPPDISFGWTAVKEGDVIEAAGFRLKAIATPGHSRGGMCYLDEAQGILFTGDTLFAGTIGRTDLFEGEYDDLIRSIMEKLIILEPDITILPGHGPHSTIGKERSSNPMLEPFNEPEDDPDAKIVPVGIHR